MNDTATAAIEPTETEIPAAKPNSPWGSIDSLGNSSFLAGTGASISIPETNISIDTEDAPIQIAEVSAATKRNLNKVETAISLISQLRTREIDMDSTGNIGFVLAEGKQPYLTYGEERYLLSPKALGDLLTLLKIDHNTYHNLQDLELRKTVLTHRLAIITPDIILAGEKLKGEDVATKYTMVLVYAAENTDVKTERVVTAVVIAPDHCVEPKHLYPMAMLKTLRDIPVKYKQDITSFDNAGIDLVDRAADFFDNKDGNGPILVPSRLAMLERETAQPFFSARLVNTKDTFSLFDGGQVSPSGICEQTCIKSGTWQKQASNYTASSFNPGGLYRWICSNGMKVLANEFDRLFIAAQRFFQAHPGTLLNITYKNEDDYHQTSIATLEELETTDVVYGHDFAVSAADFDADFQDIFREVKRAAGAEKATVITTDDEALISSVYAQIRESEENNIKALIERMRARSETPIMKDVTTILKDAELATHLIAAFKVSGTELKLDTNLVRNVCVAMLQTYRKSPLDIYKVTNWHLLNLITLLAHNLKGDKRVYAEDMSAKWVNAAIELAVREIRANRAPSGMLVSSFAKYIHAPRVKAA